MSPSGPLIACHRGIEIRYAYDIDNDQHVAHFDLPDLGGPGPQKVVKTHLRARSPGHHTIVRKGSEEVVKAVKAEIDGYLDY